MLVLNNITFEFGSRALFQDASWHIKPGDKTGLVGPNGSGKSTLLRLLNGSYRPSGGEITGRKNLSINFLDQDLLSYETEDSILHVGMEAFEQANKLHDEISDLTATLQHDHSEANLHKLHELQTRYEAMDGYRLESHASAILEGLGFTTADLARPLNSFSGGWRMRVMLAKVLLKQPDLLLLDEPTNHLDLPSIQWLEGYLQDYEGAVIVVSHDRFFLDRVSKKIVEIEQGKFVEYTGNYSFFLEEKAKRRELQQSRFNNQQRYIKSQERLIDRFRYKASKARMAQARIKMLEKLSREEEVLEDQAAMRFRLPFTKASGRMVTDIAIQSKQYGDLEIFTGTEARAERGDKIGLIGKNGKGKSTLLRIIAGTEPFEGTARTVHNVRTTFYAQHQLESLNLGYNLMQELQAWSPEKTDGELRALLGAFLFHGDDVFKKIRVLSGGEKARVALAKTMLSEANFLLLDEPTNHLDIRSSSILIDVLKEYEGSFIVVSHDRFFITEVANKIWYIEDRKLKEYPGTYDEYAEWTRRREKAAVARPARAKKKPAKRQDPVRDRKKLDQKLKKTEARMAELKARKEELVSLIQSGNGYDQERIRELQGDFTNIEKELTTLNDEWEALYMKLMKKE